MTALITDTFTDTNGTLLSAHTSNSSHTWTKVAGVTNDGYIINGRVRGTNSVGGFQFPSGVSAMSRYDIYADLYPLTLVDGSSGIAFNVQTDSNSGYYVALDAGPRWRIQKITDGTVTQLQTGSNDPSIVVDTTYSFKIEVYGATKRIYVNGQLLFTNNDTTYTSGVPGIAPISGTDSTGVHVDNFMVYGAGGTVLTPNTGHLSRPGNIALSVVDAYEEVGGNIFTKTGLGIIGP